MNVSSQDVNISDLADYGSAMELAVEEAADDGNAVWLTAGGQEIAAIVPPEVLRFYARFNDLVPEHAMHSLDGPRECDRCTIIKQNADWLFADVDMSNAVAHQTAEGTPSSTDAAASSASSQNLPSAP